MTYISYHAVAIMLIIWQVIERPACACSQKQIRVQLTQFTSHLRRTARYMGTWAELELLNPEN